jgi:hypothetical protein
MIIPMPCRGIYEPTAASMSVLSALETNHPACPGVNTMDLRCFNRSDGGPYQKHTYINEPITVPG